MQLIRYEAARTALAEAHRIDEVKDIRDKAEAMAAYARQAKDIEMIRMATEIKVRAERKCGEMLRETISHGGDRKSESRSSNPTLIDVGLTKDESSRYQKLAAMPEEHFETAIATAQATAGQVSSAYMLRMADEMKKTAAMKAQLDADAAAGEARNKTDQTLLEINAWVPIEMDMKRLVEQVAKLAAQSSLPVCKPERMNQIVTMWRTVSDFISNQMEKQNDFDR